MLETSESGPGERAVPRSRFARIRDRVTVVVLFVFVAWRAVAAIGHERIWMSSLSSQVVVDALVGDLDTRIRRSFTSDYEIFAALRGEASIGTVIILHAPPAARVPAERMHRLTTQLRVLLFPSTFHSSDDPQELISFVRREATRKVLVVQLDPLRPLPNVIRARSIAKTESFQIFEIEKAA